ncbi:MAG: molybdopterin-dependent oxidoreductase [Hyphomicrobiaceae bacterium]
MSGPVRTTCPYCGVGCGLIATTLADGSVEIAGDPEHPANFGRLCSKGAALAETLSLDDRLLEPSIDGRLADWDTALDLVARRFSETIAEHGPESVAFYVSGQILTEDYYVANKLMKGFIGAANIDTNSRLCMASSVAGHRRAFGSDTVPGTYEDLELADLVVLVGSNLSWCHPVLYQRLAAARAKRGTRIVVIDPRETASCEIADLHLALNSGSDVALFNGLLAHLAACNAFDAAYIDCHTTGADKALAAARQLSLADISRITGIGATELRAFYDPFASTERAVTVYSQGVNQSSSGTDKVNAIINCHLATGRIGKPGTGPFSVTGQPNAMGGREVGGLANMLACHMEIGNPEHTRIVGEFWRSDRVATEPGLKAVDMFRAVAEGKVKAIWIMGTNPVVSMPEADAVRAALRACPFVVVSDVIARTDTTRTAHVLLPSAAWGEKDGTVTNSERRISRQRAFLPMPGRARNDWWQICEVARRMGFAEAFNYESQWQIFAEYAALSGKQNAGTRDFDISALEAADEQQYNALAPFQWPRPSADDAPKPRFFAQGNFFTPSGKAQFIAVTYRDPASTATARHPLIMGSGRIRDQWHTMTRTAKSARLMSHIAEPTIELHPADAAQRGIRDGALATVASVHGAIVLRAQITERQRPGHVFAPMHWTSELAANARTNALVTGNADPVSGQPELKHAAVEIRTFEAAWHGFAAVRARPCVGSEDYWALAKATTGWKVELAGRSAPEHWGRYARSLFQCDDDVEILSYHDQAAGQYRLAAFRGWRLDGVLFAARSPVTVSRTWAMSLLDGEYDQTSDRVRILAGRPGQDYADAGRIVCACFSVGLNQIIDAVSARNCTTVEAIGTALNAGTNCGSCRAEIGRIIRETDLKKAG